MRNVGAGFVLLSLILFAWGFGTDAGVDAGAAGRVANLSLLNFKLLLVTTGGAVFIAGWVLAAADFICVTIKEVGATARSAIGEHRVPPPTINLATTTGVHPTRAAFLKTFWPKQERKLEDPAYRSFLLEKYPARGSNPLERHGSSFDSEDALIIFLDEVDRGLWPGLASASPKGV
jgi:hypothetical protein